MTDPLDLSAEQVLAARAPLGDVCVLAGAGSGKTRVLTARFVEHARQHGLAPRRIAALTFTEKAAREMRKRIAEAFVLVDAPALGAEAELAPVSTIHAFCARLLRRNSVAAGLDPAFAVLDQDGALLLKAEAIVRASERLEARADAALLRAALRRVVGTPPLETLLRLLEGLRGGAGEVASLTWHTAAGGLEAVRKALAESRRACAEAFDAWENAPAEAPAALALTAQVECQQGAPEEAWQALADLTIGGKGSKGPRSACAALKAALADLASALLDVEGGQHVLPALRSILLELDGTYAELKRRRQALDFTDLERETLRLLERLERRGRPVEGLPLALLVDEHQDTNPVQERILACVRRHGVPQFSVGDPKQSIYRFRGADVGVLLGEQSRVGAHGQRALAESYRATPELVAALNGLHERLFAGNAAAVPFAALASAGKFSPAAPGAPCPVSFALLGRGEESIEAGRRREALYIAAWLRTLVDGHVARRLISRPGPLGWGQCALLVRVRTDLGLYEQALTAAGIPFRVHRGRGYREAEEIAALLYALRVVHNPQDQHALACLLRGPALAASDGDLLTWFSAGAQPWERLRADTRARVQQVVRALDELRRLSGRADLPEVVAATVERLGLLAAALAQPDGTRRAANLRRAVALAGELAEAGRHDLPAFLRHLELLDSLEVEQAEAPALGEDGDAVTLMSVHAAKGLEWPVVVLADAGRRQRPTDAPYLFDGAGGVALKLKDEFEGDARAPAGYLELKERDDAAADAEALRLLYVATTRAEQHLLITATHQGPTSTGLPKGAEGWARTLFTALGQPLESGCREVSVGDGSLRLGIEDAPLEAEPLPLGAAGSGNSGRAAAAEAQACADSLADELVEVAARGPVTLGGTRYVVTVSELLTFAESPALLYRQRLSPREGRPLRELLLERPRDPEGERQVSEVRAPEDAAALRAEARARWDEPASVVEGIDRAALGRAVHLLIERWNPRVVLDLDETLASEHEGAVPPATRALAHEMLRRFEASAVAGELGGALASGADARREAAFHARVRFPAGAQVAGFEHLLVKGTIDLWLPRLRAGADGDGVWILDHKTNPPSSARPTPESLAAHYAPQLRLYALAAERLLGRDVAGAALLLLDPGWGPAAIEVPIDVSGPALEETRRLCQAFAEAERVGRWPADWRDLLR